MQNKYNEDLAVHCYDDSTIDIVVAITPIVIILLKRPALWAGVYRHEALHGALSWGLIYKTS